MKVSGFTFVRNAIKYDYPVVESITSILPICDEFIVAVGSSDDGTRELVSGIASNKIQIIDTIWDETLRKDGQVLALETDKALAAVSPESTWAFYLQADEVVHEKYLPGIKTAMEKWEMYPEIEGLVFRYAHFWGSYEYVGDSRKWYRNEVRVIRNDPQIHSYLDAQGFRKNGEKLKVAPVEATIYHYGWVKPPENQQAKQENFHRYWHSDRWIKNKVTKDSRFDYTGIDSLVPFSETHPAVMKEHLGRQNWEFHYLPSHTHSSLKNRILHWIEKKTGWRIGEYRNYRLLNK
ncbi:MAG: hypothetical protein M0P47_06200 [Bacteroidales bacterium]|nr:hypothetical protein [Bacteroidales bacterium]